MTTQEPLWGLDFAKQNRGSLSYYCKMQTKDLDCGETQKLGGIKTGQNSTPMLTFYHSSWANNARGNLVIQTTVDA